MARRTTAALSVLAIGALALMGPQVPIAAAAPAAPAAAAAVPTGFDKVVSGNFYGDGRDEMLLYAAGSAPDVMLSFSNGGIPGGDLTIDSYDLAINGTYRPVVGNFDGDAFDELLWYAPGTVTDTMWNFTSFTTFRSTPYTINGSYQTVVGDYTGDGTDDILWYAPGTAGDSVWEFNANGSRSVVPRTINGSYVPIPGSFGSNNTDDIFWYGPGAVGDSMWDFAIGSLSYVSRPIPVNGVYQPFSLDWYGDGWRGGDIFWYIPGPGPDVLWDFIFGQRFSGPVPVGGVYTPTVGDYLGDGMEDIAWLHADGFNLWDNTIDLDGNYAQIQYAVTLGPAPAAADAGRAGADASVGPFTVPGTRLDSVGPNHR